MPTLTKFMRQSMLDNKWSFADHQNYAPVIDELVLYTKQSLDDKDQLSLKDAHTLMRFGNSFNIKDAHYWRQVQSQV